MSRINWGKVNHTAQALVFIAILGYFSIQVLVYFKDVLTIFISAGLLAFLANELVHPLCKLKVPRWLAIILVHLFAIIILGLGVALVLPPVIEQAGSLINSIPQNAAKIQEWVGILQNKFTTWGIPIQIEPTIASIIDGFRNFLLKISSGFPQLLIDGFTVFINVIMVIVISIYLLLDFNTIWNKILDILPTNHKTRWEYLQKELTKCLRGFIRGQVFGSLLALVTMIIVYPLLGLNFGVIAGVYYGLASLIPYFGPFIGLLPILLLALFQGGWMLLWIFIITVALQQIRDTVILPKLMSESVGIHPLGIFIAILVGIKVGGFLGLILAIPIAGVIDAVFRTIFIHKDEPVQAQNHLIKQEEPECDLKSTPPT